MAHEIKWITVSPDFKIQEALRGMDRCTHAIAEACKYWNDWQAIAISWASR